MVNFLVGYCHNTHKNTEGKGVNFHKLPKNENLKKIWSAKVKREETREMLLLLRSLYRGRLQAEYTGLKVVPLDLCFASN